MKKLFFLLFLIPALAFGQNYPGPTFKNLTLQNPLPVTSGGTGATTATGTGSVVLSNSPSLTGTFGLTGSVTAAITSGGTLSNFLSKSGVTGQSIYTGICAGCTSYDTNQSTLTIPSGSTVTTMTGYGSYLNNLAAGGASGNGVNFFSVATCGATNSNCWGSNNVLIDNTTYATSSVTGVKLIGTEYDFDVTSTSTTVQGPTVTGSSLAQPTGADGFKVSSLSTQSPGLALWKNSFVSVDGVSQRAFYIGASATSGANQASQPVTYNYFDSGSVERAWTQQAGTNGNLQFSDNGSGHQIQVNSNVLAKPPSGTGAFTADTSAASQQAVTLYNDQGANKYQLGKGASNDFFAYDNAASRFIWDMPTGGTLAITPATSFAAGVTVTGAISATTTGTMPFYGTTGTAVNAPHMVQGSVALSAGSATVTLSGSAVYTSSSSYTCTANDTTAANAVKVGQTSGTSITLTGTGTDTVQFMCAGN